MENFEQYGIIPIDYDTVLSHLVNYKSPKDKVSRLERTGVLIRLKRGLYLVSSKISRQTPSVELIANHLYGPSYISFESALSFYGLIPERVFTVKSATTSRKKQYQTPMGNFEYLTIPAEYFSIGLHQNIIQNSHAFLIASPEKAICDMIISTTGLRLQSKKAMKSYLKNDLRLDLETNIKFNPEIIKEAAKYGYKKTELLLLYRVLEDMININ